MGGCCSADAVYPATKAIIDAVDDIKELEKFPVVHGWSVLQNNAMENDVPSDKKAFQLINDFMGINKHIVISTIHRNNPKQTESAFIEFAHNTQSKHEFDCQLMFSTPGVTRKYFNLKENNNVSVVILSEDLNIQRTIQIEGQAYELTEKHPETDELKKIFFAKNGEMAKLLPFSSYWVVKPNFVRYLDLGFQVKPLQYLTIELKRKPTQTQ